MAYLVIGGIFMYTQRGARGAEIIPNYSFWKDLPFLVMVNYTLFQSIFFQDGFFFTIRSLLYMNSTKVQTLGGKFICRHWMQALHHTLSHIEQQA